MTMQKIQFETISTIRNVNALYTQFETCLAKEEKIQLDFSLVEQIDASVLQLLCSFTKRANTLGIECQWLEVSDMTKQAINILGLQTCFEQVNNYL